MAGELPRPPTEVPITDEELDRERRIRSLLAEAADSEDFLPFDRFMEIALYDPEAGFYTHVSQKFGRSGDYYTAAHVTPLFGETIGAHLRTIHRGLGSPDRFRIVELGAGDGTLAEGILRGFVAGDENFSAIEYVLVERSPASRSEALERIALESDRLGIRRRSASLLSEDGPFEGVIVANELLDALPARRLVYREGGWHELGVRPEANGLVWAETDLRRPVPGTPLPDAVEDGSVFELAPAGEALFREIADHVTSGAALFFDYGMEENELVRSHPSGTLSALRKHRTVSDPLSHPGLNDLTTFVNFSRMRESARRAGLRPLRFRPQRDALAEWGFGERLTEGVRAARSSEEEVRLRLAAKNLLFGFERYYALEFETGELHQVTSSAPVAPA